MAETLPINFGIIGCAEIARKVSQAINLSPNSNLHSIASRSIQKAHLYAQSNGFPPSTKLYGNYDELLEDPDVDAVYIPLPTSLHREWAVRAAQKNKHVLLEKPPALNVDQLDVILSACQENGVQFMDGTMWTHHPRTRHMAHFLDDPSRFGELKSIQATFTFAASNNFLENDIRVKPDLDSLGALGDIGWYCIRANLFAANYELPKYVIAQKHLVKNKQGVILACGASLHWEDGKIGTFYCSFLSNLTMYLSAIGTKGTLSVNDFVVPFKGNVGKYMTSSEDGLIDMELEWTKEPLENHVSTDLPQQALMVKEFSSLVDGIKRRGLAPEMKWPTLTRKNQVVIDAVVASIERGFEPVEVCY